MSVPMALFGLVWLLRVRSSVCACAGCRKERAAPLSLPQPQPQPQRQTQPQTAATAADTAVPQLGYDVITVESFTKDANVQTEFEDDEDIDGMGDAFADRNIELQVCGTSVSAGNFEYPRSQELDNKIEEEAAFNILTQSPGRSSWQEKRRERDVQPLDAEWEEVWLREQVQLERGAGGLGLSIAGGAGAGGELCVTRLAERGAAQLDGRLQLGDIIEQVNDIPLAGASHAMAVDALQRAGAFVNIRVRRARRPRIVALSRGARGLGLGVAGGADAAAGARGVFVSHVAPGGAAAADGRLRTGDRILAVIDVNGVETSLSNVTHAQAVTALRNAGERLSLVILPAARISDTHRIYSQRTQATSCSTLHELLEGQEAFDIPRCVRIVRLTRSGSRLGMDIVGGAEAEAGGVFVSGVAAGGSAAGRLYRGDRILSVDGRDLSRATHEQAAAALKFSSDSVTIAAQYQPDQYARLRARIQAINAASQVGDSNDLSEDYPR